MALKRAGIAQLKLHPGKAPHWLVKCMMPMASALCEFIVDEYGSKSSWSKLSTMLRWADETRLWDSSD